MKLRAVIENASGFRYILDHLEVQSTAAKNVLRNSLMMTDSDTISKRYAELRLFADAFSRQDNRLNFQNLQFRLQKLKNLNTTFEHLTAGNTLDDIEFFEVKQLAMLAAEVRNLLAKMQLENVFSLPDIEPVVAILDPDKLRIATFYIYDSYSDKLPVLRKQLEQNPTDEQIYNALTAEENAIRQKLSENLRIYAEKIAISFQSLAMIDITIAKAKQMEDLGLCFPEIANAECHQNTENLSTEYKGLFHPEVKTFLAKESKDFQPIDITFSQAPTLITGSNMGGKTVVLKSVGLCQYLFQFGFGLPAKSAKMTIYDEVYSCLADGQSLAKGLSSFAAEMKNIDEVIRAANSGKRILALIDEPARTTNPTEGTALVSALVSLLKEKQTSSIIVTHYNIKADDCACLRVKGMENGKMNYSLMVANPGDVPHEALAIAESIGIDNEWISKAKAILKV